MNVKESPLLAQSHADAGSGRADATWFVEGNEFYNLAHKVHFRGSGARETTLHSGCIYKGEVYFSDTFADRDTSIWRSFN